MIDYHKELVILLFYNGVSFCVYARQKYWITMCNVTQSQTASTFLLRGSLDTRVSRISWPFRL